MSENHLSGAQLGAIAARVITVSDRCSQGDSEDTSGPLAAELLTEHNIHVDHIDVVPDGIDSVNAAIQHAISDGARLIFTTGGTGVAPRDLTPEGTEPLLAARLDGIADAIRRRGAEHVSAAVLSRGLVGITSRGPRAALVVNAPGSTGGVRDAVAVIGPLVTHVLDQLAGGDHPRQK